MSKRMLVIIAAIVVVIAFGTVLAFKRAVKFSTGRADMDAGAGRGVPTAPRNAPTAPRK